jgi:hypothetical protein
MSKRDLDVAENVAAWPYVGLHVICIVVSNGEGKALKWLLVELSDRLGVDVDKTSICDGCYEHNGNYGRYVWILESDLFTQYIARHIPYYKLKYNFDPVCVMKNRKGTPEKYCTAYIEQYQVTTYPPSAMPVRFTFTLPLKSMLFSSQKLRAPKRSLCSLPIRRRRQHTRTTQRG